MSELAHHAPRVLVLLSIHGTAPHLVGQLESILTQRGVLVELLIFNDRASNDVLEAITRLESRGLRCKVLTHEFVSGLPDVYVYLLQEAPFHFDMYCFADSDDTWHPEKLKTAWLSMRNSTTPILWISGWTEFEDEGGANEEDKLAISAVLGGILVETPAPGCCFVWNQALAAVMAVPDARDCVMHDSWVAAWAALNGRIEICPESLVRYRIHENNSIGRTTSLYSRLRTFDSSTWSTRRRQAGALLALSPHMSASDERLLATFAGGPAAKRILAWVRRDLRRHRFWDSVLLAVFDIFWPTK